jgi:hypothetical protein
MSLCLAGLSDITVVLLGLNDGDTPESPGAHAMQCAFGWAVNLLPLLPVMALPVIIIAQGNERPLFWRTSSGRYLPELRGPPLGPRAPPA